MKKFLSKYSFIYVRSLVYMLQASEYNIADFFGWFRRAEDFRRVETRKMLVKTTKAIILLTFGWLLHIFFFIMSLSTFWIFDGYASFVALAVSIFIFPYFTLYAIAIFAYLLNLLQSPLEKIIVNRAKAKLKNHKALKIGIAGSYGKTTMKEILKAVLGESKKVAATPDNKNTPLGIARFVKNLDGDEEILIFEMGEYYPGDIKKLCQMVGPDMGVITGVNEAHMDKFKNLEETAKTVFELADFLERKSGSKLYVNGDNRLSEEKAHHVKNKNPDSPKLYTYNGSGIKNLSSQSESDWKVSEAASNLSGTNFVLKNDKSDGIVANSKLLGLHQVGPLAAAMHLAKCLGIKTEFIELGIKKTEPFEHRLQLKEEVGGIIVIDDSYNGSPDGVKAAINFLSDIKNKRRFYITPGLVEMGRRAREIHIQIGKWLADAEIEKVVLVRNSVTPFIVEGLKEENFAGEIIWFESAGELFSSLPKQTVNNDLLLYQNDWPDNYY